MAFAENTFWMNTYEEHGSSILAFLTSRVGRRDVAEDLLQETFVRAMRQGDRLGDHSRIRSYLFTTAHHLVVDRSRRKRPSLFTELASDASAPPIEIEDVAATPADSQADMSLMRSRLEQVLEQLTPAHSTAFRLAVLEQRPYAEVASSQGWSLEQVKTNVHRARKKVVEQLQGLLRTRPGSES